MIIYMIELIILLIMLYFYLKYNFTHFIASLFVVYSFISIYLSTLYLDVNFVYSPEMGKYMGGCTHSALNLLIYMLLFIFASKIVFNKKRKALIEYLYKKNINKKHVIYGVDFYRLMSYLIFIYLFITFLYMLTTPLPIFSGIDRVTYFRNYGNILFIVLIKLTNIFGILLGILYVYSKNNKHNKKLIKYSFYLFLIILFIAGNKFSTPLRFILFYVLPLGISSINIKDFKNIPIKTMATLLIGIFIFISITLLYINMFFGDRNLVDYLIDRLMISQGQLWWDYNSNYFYFNWSINDFYNAFNNTFVDPLYDFQGNKFLLFLMDQTINTQQLFNRMENGYLYTGAYPAFLVVLLSPLGSIVFHFLLSLIYSFLLYYFFISMAKKLFFTTIMIGYLKVSLLFIFVTSDFGHLSTYILKFLLIIVAYTIDTLLQKEKKYV